MKPLQLESAIPTSEGTLMRSNKKPRQSICLHGSRVSQKASEKATLLIRKAHKESQVPATEKWLFQILLERIGVGMITTQEGIAMGTIPGYYARPYEEG